MTTFLETANRVFRVDILPDTEGCCPRTLTLSVESGPLLTEEEYLDLSKRIVAYLVAEGVGVKTWSNGLEDPPHA